MRRSTIPFLSDLYASILLTFRIVFHAIVTFAHFKDFFVGLLRQYLADIKDSLLSDCYVGIARSLWIPFHLIFMLISFAVLGYFFIGLLG